MRKRVRVQLLFDNSPSSRSKTKQSYRDECNINKIMAKARKTGLLPVSSKEPYYGDFSSAVDFHMAQNRLIQAKESFDALPVNIRKKFGYDAGRLMEFLENPENEAEAVKLGLLKAKAPSAEDLAAQKAAADAARKDALKADLAALGVKLA